MYHYRPDLKCLCIKMSTCEINLTTLVRSEVVQVFKGGVVRAVSSTFIFGGARLIIVYLIVLPFTLSGNTLTPKSVITTISLIYVIRLVFIISVVRCFFVVYEAYVAIVRIQVRKIYL